MKIIELIGTLLLLVALVMGLLGYAVIRSGADRFDDDNEVKQK